MAAIRGGGETVAAAVAHPAVIIPAQSCQGLRRTGAGVGDAGNGTVTPLWEPSCQPANLDYVNFVRSLLESCLSMIAELLL